MKHMPSTLKCREVRLVVEVVGTNQVQFYAILRVSLSFTEFQWVLVNYNEF